MMELTRSVPTKSNVVFAMAAEDLMIALGIDCMKR
jgi:hypothetical protein